MHSRRPPFIPLAIATLTGAVWAIGPAWLPAQPSISHDPEDLPRPAARGSGGTEADGKSAALVSAAVADAVEQLRRDVLGADLTDELTVRQAFRRLRAEEAVGRLIQSADQRGSPRWRDAGGREAGGCEVRLELPGSAVADALLAVAEKQNDPDLSPRRLAPALARLRRQTFAAVGVGGGGRTEAARPSERTPQAASPSGPPAATPDRPGRTDGRRDGPDGDPPDITPPVPPRLPRPPALVRPFAPAAPAAPVRRAAVPADAPAWATDQITVQGKVEGSGLRGARAAEAAALAQVRRRVDQLQLSPDFTVGEACKSDANLERAVTEALSRAQVESTLYGRQQVTVRVSMDLELVWRRILATRR